MVHKLSYQQRLLQKMSLTPQMRQSIKLLSLSVKDLGDYVESITANNPFLQKLVDKNNQYKKGTAVSAASELPPDYTERSKQAVNPRTALVSQLKMAGLEDKLLEIAEYLIYEMDENGYITIASEEVASDLSATLEEVEEAVKVIQSMDPPGIGAGDIRECLQLQLKRQNKEGSLEYRIVTDFLNELAQNDADKISKALKVDKDAVREALNRIKKLNPRPVSTILSRESEQVIPDLVARIEDKKVRLELNREYLPRLKLYNPYKNDLDIIKDPEARDFLRENLDFAKSLMDNLKRREDTVCSVANYILTYQKDGLKKDKYEIKSLTIKDVAEALDFHPSTISRAISHKHVQINDKVVALKSLLSHGIKKENGELTSKTSVKTLIERLVASEDRSKPLSDSAIKTKLESAGIKLVRRTVAKYRKELKVLPAYLRKKARST